MKTLKMTLLALATALLGIVAFANQPNAASREQLRDSVSVQVIDEFLADSKRYLEL